MDAAAPPRFGNLVRSLVVGIGLAYLATVLLVRAGLSLPVALAISAVFPIADAGYEYARRHHIGAIDVLSLVGIVAGVALSLVSGDARFALAKESVMTGVIGAGFLVTLALPRPAIFFLARETVADAHLYEERWRNVPFFRATLRGMTVFWGVGMVVESALRITCAMTLPPGVTLGLSPLIAAVTFAVLIGGTLAWARRANAHGRALAARETATPQ